MLQHIEFIINTLYKKYVFTINSVYSNKYELLVVAYLDVDIGSKSDSVNKIYSNIEINNNVNTQLPIKHFLIDVNNGLDGNYGEHNITIVDKNIKFDPSYIKIW